MRENTSGTSSDDTAGSGRLVVIAGRVLGQDAAAVLDLLDVSAAAQWSAGVTA
ncbi:MAG: hypothetical protein ACRDNW_21610 [Trebonia sp.]